MYLKNEDTICAPATVPGTGAICVIRVSGNDALTVADKVISCRDGNISEAKGYSIKFGTVYAEGGEVLDEVLVSIFRAPYSYTGENSVEISCHSSSYIVSSLMGLLFGAGARAADPGEFTMRAFLNGKMDLAQAEAVADVIASRSAASHRIAFKQMKGGFSDELKQMREKLIEIASLMELELDFSEEDVEFADRSRLDSLLEKSISHITTLIKSFKSGNAIKNGVPVAIVGATNTGKSTLLNALTGEERAIVSDIHGTTRDTIEETVDIDGILFRFIDTAGLRETSETIEKIGIERTFQKISEASVVLGMIDLTRDYDSSCETVREICEKIDFESQKLFILLNKTDICPVNKNVSILNFIVSYIENKGISKVEVIPLSAKTSEGIPNLRRALADSQKNLLADSGTTLVTNSRHIQALTDALTALTRLRTGLAANLPSDLAAQDLREALYHLGSITGDITTDEILGTVFSRFCVGK